MRSSDLCFPRKVFSNLAPIMTHGVVHVSDQLVLANPPLGVHIFLGYFWCNHGRKMVLTKSLFTWKNIEDQGFRSSGKYR
jgi:hypothetical protein